MLKLYFQMDTIKIAYENDNYVFKNSKDEIISYVENNKYLQPDERCF